VMQFPRKPKRLRRPHRRHTPRIVIRGGKHPTRIVERLPHAAEGIADVPRPTQGTQAVVAVEVIGGPVGEHLAQRRGEILRRGGGAVAEQDAVTVVLRVSAIVTTYRVLGLLGRRGLIRWRISA